MFAAIAIRMFVGRVAQTIRMTMVVIRAMQKPNIMPEMVKLWPRARFTWKMVMWEAGADDEEDEEDSAYWDVNGDGGDEAEGCGRGRVWW